MSVSLGGQPLAILDRNAGHTRLNSASEAMIKSIAPSPSKKGIEIRGWRLRQKIFYRIEREEVRELF